MRLTWIVTLLTAVLVVLFVVSNTAPVALGLWPFDARLVLPLSLAVLVIAAVAFLFGATIAWLSSMRGISVGSCDVAQVPGADREHSRPDRAGGPRTGNAFAMRNGPPPGWATAVPVADASVPGTVREVLRRGPRRESGGRPGPGHRGDRPVRPGIPAARPSRCFRSSC